MSRGKRRRRNHGAGSGRARHRYIASLLITKEGDEYQGYIMAEDSNEVRLRETLANQFITIPKSQIQDRRQSGSIMPAGLVDQLSRQEFVDLVKYLSGLGE